MFFDFLEYSKSRLPESNQWQLNDRKKKPSKEFKENPKFLTYYVVKKKKKLLNSPSPLFFFFLIKMRCSKKKKHSRGIFNPTRSWNFYIILKISLLLLLANINLPFDVSIFYEEEGQPRGKERQKEEEEPPSPSKTQVAYGNRCSDTIILSTATQMPCFESLHINSTTHIKSRRLEKKMLWT